jgi:hypothetical protein
MPMWYLETERAGASGDPGGCRYFNRLFRRLALVARPAASARVPAREKAEHPTARNACSDPSNNQCNMPFEETALFTWRVTEGLPWR